MGDLWFWSKSKN